MHEQHAADPLALVLGRIEHGRTGFDLARIDAAEGDGADERVVHDLEGEHRERVGVARHANDVLAGVHVDALDAAAIDRRGQIVDDRVEEGLHALVLERRTAQHRHERDLLDRLANEALQRIDVRLLPVEIGGHHVVVELDRGLDQRMPEFLRLRPEIGRNFLVVVLGAEALVLPDDRLHPQEVDHALERGLRPDRQLDADRTTADLGLDLVDTAKEIGPDLVHLVDEHDARNAVFVGLAPDRLRLRLDPLVAVEHAHRPVEHP